MEIRSSLNGVLDYIPIICILGIIIGFVFMMTNLCSVKSFGKPFMLPLSPKLNIKNRKKLIKKGLIAQNTYKGEI